MDPLLNPFTPGAGTRPTHLVGRDPQIQSFRVMLARLTRGQAARSPILYGLRGVGKTVLLHHEFATLAGEHRWRVVSLEARAGLDFEGTLVRELHRALLGLSPGARARDRVQRALRVLRSFELTHRPDGSITAGLRVEPERGFADSGDREHDLTELLVAIAEASQGAASGIAILIDEMQLLEKGAIEAVVAAVHEIAKRALPLAVAGAGLPNLPRLIAEAKTYAERIFDYQPIGNLDEAAAADALQRPAVDAGGRFDDDALALILERSHRYPYFLQVYGSRVWDVAPGPERIRLADVEVALPLIQDELDRGFFHVRWEKASERERDYLRAMAGLGDGPQATRAVAGALGKRPSALSVIRDRLIQKGVIYAPDHGLVDFTAPLFGDYVRRRPS